MLSNLQTTHQHGHRSLCQEVDINHSLCMHTQATPTHSPTHVNPCHARRHDYYKYTCTRAHICATATLPLLRSPLSSPLLAETPSAALSPSLTDSSAPLSRVGSTVREMAIFNRRSSSISRKVQTALQGGRRSTLEQMCVCVCARASFAGCTCCMFRAFLLVIGHFGKI